MLPIYICTQQLHELNHYQTIINNILFMEEYDARLVLATCNPKQLIYDVSIHNIDNCTMEALYILDLDIHTLIPLADKLRAIDSRGFIVLILQERQSLTLALQHHIEALDIIPKEHSWNLGLRLNLCIEASLQRSISHHSSSMFSFMFHATVIQIPFREILYITTISNRLLLVTHHQSYEFYGTLTHCLEQLDDRFLFCHRAFIVNMNLIRSVDTKHRIITFYNNETCIASVRGIHRILKYIEKIR